MTSPILWYQSAKFCVTAQTASKIQHERSTLVSSDSREDRKEPRATGTQGVFGQNSTGGGSLRRSSIMEDLHQWLAKYLAPEPNADTGDEEPGVLESIHSWAGSILAPDPTPAPGEAQAQPQQQQQHQSVQNFANHGPDVIPPPASAPASMTASQIGTGALPPTAAATAVPTLAPPPQGNASLPPVTAPLPSGPQPISLEPPFAPSFAGAPSLSSPQNPALGPPQ
eukprot:m.489440 g.489440  ORF g.489440 m.489440 type:complete len:225 (+) comp26747_c0_seq1:26-700(+)